jgi:Fe-S-cluster containining protein
LAEAVDQEMPLNFLPYCAQCRVEGIDQYCCKVGTILVLPHERDRIVRLTGKDEFIDQGDYFLIKKAPDGYCAFFSQGRCSLGEAKPLICRVFPMMFRKQGSEIDRVPAGKCPAITALPKDQLERFIKSTEELFAQIPRDIAERYCESFDWAGVQRDFDIPLDRG